MTALAVLALAISHTVIAVYLLRRIDLLADQIIHTLGIQKHEPVTAAPSYNEPSIENQEPEILTDEDEYQIERMKAMENNKSRVSVEEAREGLRRRGL